MRRAWSPVGRRLILSLVGLMILILAGIGGAIGWLLWQLSGGPIEIASLPPRIEAAIAAEFGDVNVDVGAAELDTDPEGQVVVRLTDVTINDLGGSPLVRAPRAVVSTRLIDAAFGSMTPTSIELVGPHLFVSRLADGSVNLGFGPNRAPRSETVEQSGADTVGADNESTSADEAELTDQAGGTIGATTFSPIGVFQPGADNAGVLTTLKQLLVRRARLTVYDEASQSIWDSYDATFSIKRPGSGLAVIVDAPFTTDTGEWRLRLAVEQERADTPIETVAAFYNVVPSEIAARIPSLADLAGFDMPVSGRISASLSPAGVIRTISADLSAGAGFLRRLPFLDDEMAPFLVDEASVAAVYSREKQRIEIERFVVLVGTNRVSLSGTIAPERNAAGVLSAASIDLRAEDLRVAADDIARPPATITRALASGRLTVAPLALELDAVALEFPRGRIALGGTVALDGPRSFSIQGNVEDLPVDALVQIWPRGVAPGARRWIASRIPTGRIRDAQIALALDETDIEYLNRGAAIDDDAIRIDFGFDGVTAHYLEHMPPIEAGIGRAEVSGDRLVVSAESGIIKSPSGQQLAVTFGRFSIPTFADAGSGELTGKINVGTGGSMAAALEILDLKPLEFTRGLGVNPALVTGDATVLLGLTLPLVSDIEFRQIEVQAGATLTDVRVAEIFKSVTLEANKLEILATHQRIEAVGNVRLNGVPAIVDWDARIDPSGRRMNQIGVEANISAEDLKRIGIDITSLVSGTAAMTLEASGPGSRLDNVTVKADVTEALMQLPAIGWEKLPGEKATLALAIERLDNDQVRLSDISLTGDSVTVEGAIRLDPDGSLYKFDMDRMRFGAKTEISVAGVRGDDGALRVTVRGKRFDAGPILRREIAGDGPDDSDETARPVNIDFEVGQIDGAGDAALSGSTGLVRLRGGKVQSLRLRGAFASRGPIELDYAQGSGSAPAVVTIDTGDAGAFVRFLGLYSRAFGGAMAVRARGPDSKTLTGVISARGFQIHDEPLIARIVASQSGIPASAARNVQFSKLNLNFQRNGGVLEIKEALIAAPAVGASLRGRVDIAGEALGLSGTYVPAYGLNAAFGAIPLVGPILSGRSGEGVFGMTFGVDGPMSNPRITINPMSAVAPGLLRRFFEFRQR